MRILMLATASSAAILWLTPAGLYGATLQGSVARVDITPPPEMKASLGGYGERMSRPAEGVHDRLLAKALVVTDGPRRFTIVTADILGFPPPFKGELVAQLAVDGWKAEQILLLPSHSHTSIDMMQIHTGNKLPIPQLGLFHAQLHQFTVAKFASLIRDASQQLRPIRVGTASCRLEGWNANRREGGTIVDNTLTLTRIDTQTGTPLAVLVNWTAHPTIMSGKDMLYSAGWPGHLQRQLEKLVGQDVTVMYYNGAQGDQRPVGPPDSSPDRWIRAEQYGTQLAAEVYKLFPQATVRADAPLAFHTEPIALPSAEPHPGFMDTGGSEYGLTKNLMGTLLSSILPRATHSTSVRLGDLVIVGAPGELAAELGLEVKRQVAQTTGAEHVTIGGLADEWVSYVLPEAEYRRGGYESSVSFYGPTLGDVIVQGMCAGAARLHDPQP